MHASRPSRRLTPEPLHRRLRQVVAAAAGATLALTALLPGLATAQDGDAARSLEHKWQLLSYRAPDQMEPVPAGVGVTMVPFGGRLKGDAACSSFETTYSEPGKFLFVDPTEPEYVECDQASREFDETFYELLFATGSYVQSGSILTLLDEIDEELLQFTRAEIDEDPTAARWDLARIGDADGSVEPVIVGLESWIEFLRGGRVVGRTGCGSFFGDYRTDRGTMHISGVRYRLHDACTDGQAAQAEKIVATLDEIASFEVLPAGLRLQDANGTTRLALTPVVELDSRIWTPTVVYNARGDVLAEGEQLSTSAISLHADNADGGSICRPFTADGLRSGLALSISDFDFQGEKRCPKPKNADAVNQRAIESAFIGALRATASHALRGSQLEFKDVDGNTLMLLEPQAELLNTVWVVEWLGRQRTEAIGDAPLTVTFTESDLVTGDTGVVRSGIVNTYIGFFSTPTATRIRIGSIDITNPGFCSGAKRKKQPICQQQATFIALLEEVDRYIARETDLKLYRGTDDVMKLVPQSLLVEEE